MSLRICLMERDYERAGHLLSSSRRSNYNDMGFGGPAGMVDGYSFPKAWYEGLVARARGDARAAHAAFESAHRVVHADLMHWTDDPKTSAMLALVEAALGKKEEALRLASRAVELLPVSRDAYDGPILETNLAVVEAHFGESDRAIKCLSKLASLPNGPTPGTLRVEPEWDSLRDDPRFEKLAAT
jgi:serine/threonine-protein kinase